MNEDRRSPEFSKFCRFMHQDTWLVFSTPQEVITGGLQYMGVGGVSQLKAYLDTILDGSVTDEAIAHLWDMAGAEWSFSNPHDARRFLQQVRSAIG